MCVNIDEERRDIQNMGLTSYILLGIVLCANVSIGFIFTRTKQDCSVSYWSAWSEPFGNGTIIRERMILQYPLHGGTPCPDLTETQYTNAKPASSTTLASTATSSIEASSTTPASSATSSIDASSMTPASSATSSIGASSTTLTSTSTSSIEASSTTPASSAISSIDASSMTPASSATSSIEASSTTLASSATSSIEASSSTLTSTAASSIYASSTTPASSATSSIEASSTTLASSATSSIEASSTTPASTAASSIDASSTTLASTAASSIDASTSTLASSATSSIDASSTTLASSATPSIDATTTPSSTTTTVPTTTSITTPTTTSTSTTYPPTTAAPTTTTAPSDCKVSDWSTWSEPFGFGTMIRERRLLRYALNGGIPCPDLTQTKSTNVKPTITQTASVVANSFLRRRHAVQLTAGQLRDLLVIVDSSGSISYSGFVTAKTQLAELLGLLCPTPDPFETGYQQAALIEYSSKVIEVFDFNDKNNTSQIQTAIKNMNYLRGSTCTATAFQRGKNMFTSSKGMRTSCISKHEVLIITDGQSNCGGDAVAAAKVLQRTADVYALMVGISHHSRAKDELLSYVSMPINTHLFAIDGYQDLEKLVELIKSQQSTDEPCPPFDIPQ